MTTSRSGGSRRRRLGAVIGAALGLTIALTGAGVATAAGQANVALVRQVTEKYHDINAAIADGYVMFYRCTEQPGVGTMGQHFVKPPLVGDPAVDPLQPEVLVYAPKRSGEWKLVAVEYVTIAAAWQAAFGSATPRVLGQDMLFRAAGNRYGLPDFYERHAWIWQGNPRGTFDDWNPSISCLGNGDNGG
jgi:hypothetical protein